jgi:HSP20 family protein
MLLNPWIIPWSDSFGPDPFERLEREIGRAFRVDREPRLDVWSNENELRIALCVPGFAPEEVDVSLDGDVLMLAGARAAKALADGERWHLRERDVERFTRTLRLPFRVEANDVQARYEHGILWITLPRAQTDRAKKIAIRTQA